MMNNKKLQKRWSEIVAKAWSDASFKEKLLLHPSKILKKHGIDLKGVNVEILENRKNKTYLVIPSNPEKRITERELKKTSGARHTDTSSCMPSY